MQHTFDIGGGRQAFVGANGRYSGEAYAAFTVVEALRIREYALLDVRAGLQSDDGAWRPTAFGRNVTNQYYWNGAFRSGDTSIR